MLAVCSGGASKIVVLSLALWSSILNPLCPSAMVLVTLLKCGLNESAFSNADAILGFYLSLASYELAQCFCLGVASVSSEVSACATLLSSCRQVSVPSLSRELELPTNLHRGASHGSLQAKLGICYANVLKRFPVLPSTHRLGRSID